ncbi:MAG: phosphatase PAP2 family protein [Ignavibacteria bacterium]|jgi:membrane-associated phospholipid phosphatase
MKNFRLKIILSFLLIFCTSINSQNKYNFDQFIEDGGKIFERPVKWNTKDWTTLGLFSLSTYLIMNYDDDIKYYIQTKRNNSDNFLMKFGTYYGEPFVPLIAALGFYTHGVSADNKANRIVAFEITEAFLYTAILTTFTKYAFGRERPFLAKSGFEFHPFSFRNNDYMSFFSGHTSSAFSLSTILAENTTNNTLKVIAYVPAFITGFSRIYHNNHWTSDVFMGAIAGYFVGKFVHDLHKEKDENVYSAESTTPLINIVIPF